MTDFINHNGKIIRQENLGLSPDNRSFRYGDGCFETIRLINGNIILENYHFERLFTSLSTLKFDIPKLFTPHKLSTEIKEVASKNGHIKNCRVRLTVYRGDGGLYDEISHRPNYIIQTWPLDQHISDLNENGLQVGIYADAKKASDNFSHIKSNNFLGYAMGALWAKQNKLNDAILLNSFDRIADATIANVFIVKDGIISTPPLSDGPINGVMRRHLLRCFKDEGIPTHESSIGKDEILQASEVFLTNSVYGIRWVKKIENSSYSNQLAKFIHGKFITHLFK